MDYSHDIDEANWLQCDEQEYSAGVATLHMARQSTCMNEDDYDYAIELSRDDEYRQAADALPNIAELDDVDDDDLLIFLDDKRQSVNEELVSASPKYHGLIKHIRESLSLLQPRRKDGPNNETKIDCESNTCRLDQRESDCSEIDMLGSSYQSDPIGTRQPISDAPSPRWMSPSSKLSDTSCKLEAGLLDDPPSPKKSNTWLLSSIWEAKAVSFQRDAAGVKSWTVNEPSNPVKSLFQPHSILSRKGLMIISTKGKTDNNEVKQYESSKSSDGKS